MMEKKIRVLVDGVGGDVGQGVVKCLQDSSLDVELFVSCISEQSSWLYKIPNSFIFPYVSDDHYIAYLIGFLNKHNIDVFFPTVDSSLIKLSTFKDHIERNTNAIVFIDNFNKIDICDDKLKTSDFLEKNNFPSPITVSLNDKDAVARLVTQCNFPLVVKPKSGNGSKNIFIVETAAELESHFGKENLIAQQYLDISNGEITAGIYIGDDSLVKAMYILKRELKGGSTYKAERIFDENLELKIAEIALKMGMKYINIQAIYQNNVLLPFEFNGRLSGTTGVMRSVFNAPEMFIRERILNENLAPSHNKKKIFFSRYAEEVIYTEDDIAELKRRSSNHES
jgi:carbamoyl-phosphate synthase large subunit